MHSQKLLRFRTLASTLSGSRVMASQAQPPPIHFGPFDVTSQVFYQTSLSFALVNLKPLLPGHVLISPHRVVPRLTDLSPEEVTDLFTTVQKVETMLAHIYFGGSEPNPRGSLIGGSFNIAVQDGPDAGQSVPHVHCHIIPRLKENGGGDEIYHRMASDEGNVGGALWDRDHRPHGGGKFPKIEDSAREPRNAEVMASEAQYFKEQMHALRLIGR